MDNELKYVVVLMFGDHSNDGHEKTAESVYRSNKSTPDWERALDRAWEILGFSIIESVAKEYEDSKIGFKYLSILRQYGYQDDLEDEFMTDSYDVSETRLIKDSYGILQEDYESMILFAVTLGDPEILYKPEGLGKIIAGGYGLFQ